MPRSRRDTERRTLMKNLVLIGMAGSAKSTTGRMLAKKTNMPFFDTDEVYVSYFGESISDTFARLGEEEFRKRETAIATMLGKADGAVIACGGGIVLREENMIALKRNAVVVLLTASPEEIYARVSRNGRRPLLRDGGIEKVKAMMSEREPLYKKYADITVDNTYIGVDRCTDKIIALFNEACKR